MSSAMMNPVGGMGGIGAPILSGTAPPLPGEFAPPLPGGSAPPLPSGGAPPLPGGSAPPLPGGSGPNLPPIPSNSSQSGSSGLINPSTLPGLNGGAPNPPAAAPSLGPQTNSLAGLLSAAGAGGSMGAEDLMKPEG